jgi:hypothetical protein
VPFTRRHSLRDAELLRLAPRQPWRQRSHALLLQGSLHGNGNGGAGGGNGGSGNGGGSGSGGGRGDLEAPAVLPWLLGQLAQAAGGPAVGLQLPTCPRFQAGSSGALLLVCPERRHGSPLTPSTSIGSASELGSPWPRFGRREEAAGQPGVAEREFGEQAQQEGGREGSGRKEAGQRLEPDGQPLHRIKSRRQA